MADAAVSFLVSDMLLKLTSPAIKKFRLLRGLEDDVLALRDTLDLIKGVLQDAEGKQTKQKAVEIWLKSIRSASLEMEDVLDEVETEDMLQSLRVRRGVIYRVRSAFSFNRNSNLIRYRISQKVYKIRKKLYTIATNKSDFNLNYAMDPQVSGETQRQGGATTSFVRSSEIHGRDQETKLIADMICNLDKARPLNDDDVRVYAIWGMPGVGKSTLAGLVCQHEKVRTHFDLKVWVHVGYEFDIVKVARRIIESIHESECKLSQLESLLVALSKSLIRRRFLIVLDDIWSDNKIPVTPWQVLSKALSYGAEGSIVLVTTRSQAISTMMGRVPDFEHRVNRLSDAESWSLFMALKGEAERKEENISELMPIAMEILEKCKGLPLALKALGSLMWSKCSDVEWQRLNESDIWEMQENEVNILPALEISYNNLLPHMKRCFAYCCMFPKDYEMTADLLIKLWIANGFIPSRVGVDLYVVGEEIFNCLVWMSFFQDVQDESLNIKDRKWKPMHQKICKMHDLMYDLARYVMKNDCLFTEERRKTWVTPDQVLHLSSSERYFDISNVFSERLRSLRSILIFAHVYKGTMSDFPKHKYLRVLHLMGFHETGLPESIAELKLLRYLNLSGSYIIALPNSIMYLQNLRFLILQSCLELRMLPKAIKYMRNLECLDIKNCLNLEGMPVGMKELTRLRSLSTFIVGYKKNVAKLGELEDLDFLGNELEIQGLGDVTGLEDAKKANLKCKRNLVSLALDWTKNGRTNLLTQHEAILEGLEPNASLKELKISSFYGNSISPSWMANLINLVRIEFWHCDTKSIPPLGKLPKLRYIYLSYMIKLECFHDEDDSPTDDALFPCLEELSIFSCRNFRSLPSNFLNLKKLQISDCLELRSLPDRLQNLTHLAILGCEDLARRCEKETGEDWCKISHVLNILLH